MSSIWHLKSCISITKNNSNYSNTINSSSIKYYYRSHMYNTYVRNTRWFWNFYLILRLCLLCICYIFNTWFIYFLTKKKYLIFFDIHTKFCNFLLFLIIFKFHWLTFFFCETNGYHFKFRQGTPSTIIFCLVSYSSPSTFYFRLFSYIYKNKRHLCEHAVTIIK